MELKEKLEYIPIFLKTLPWYTKIVSSEIKKNIFFKKTFIKNKQNHTHYVKKETHYNVLNAIKYRSAFFKRIYERPRDIKNFKCYKPDRLYKRNIFYYKSNYDLYKDTSNDLKIYKTLLQQNIVKESFYFQNKTILSSILKIKFKFEINN